MTSFPKGAKVTARVHESVKDKLKRSKYNARQAIEYFVDKVTDERTAMEIEEYFLIKEIDNMKYDLITMEKRLEDLQKIKKDMYGDDISELQISSYQKIISMYAEYSEQFTNRYDDANYSLNDFVQIRGIQKTIIHDLAILDCPMNEYVEGLLDYYHDVRQISQTS